MFIKFFDNLSSERKSGGDLCGYIETVYYSRRLNYSIQIFENQNCPSPLNVVVPVFQGGDVRGYMETQSHSLRLNFSIPMFENFNFQSSQTFVVPVFQGGDVCGYIEREHHSLRLNYSKLWKFSLKKRKEKKKLKPFDILHFKCWE